MRRWAWAVATVVLARAVPAAGDWSSACVARLAAAKAELAKASPIFAKATVKLERFGTPTFRLLRRDAEDYEAGARPTWGGWRTLWYDPGCGEGCPVLIAQRETFAYDAWYFIRETRQPEETQQLFATVVRKAIDECLAIPEGGDGFGPGFWNGLVKAGARWELTSPIGEGTVVAETYDVRPLAGAEVARLRWTFTGKDGKKQDVGDSAAGRYTQLAVTPAGLYLLDADQDDAAVTTALAKKPARSDPPKPYGPTEQNQGRFLDLIRTSWGPVACLGVGPVHDSEKPLRREFGLVCVSPSAGVVRIDGKWTPTGGIFMSKAFEK
jgi:hypothetical protein